MDLSIFVGAVVLQGLCVQMAIYVCKLLELLKVGLELLWRRSFAGPRGCLTKTGIYWKFMAPEFMSFTGPMGAVVKFWQNGKLQFAMERDTPMGCSIKLCNYGCLQLYSEMVRGPATIGGDPHRDSPPPYWGLDNLLWQATPTISNRGCKVLLPLDYALREDPLHTMEGSWKHSATMDSTFHDGSRRMSMQIEYGLNERHRERRVSFVRL